MLAIVAISYLFLSIHLSMHTNIIKISPYSHLPKSWRKSHKKATSIYLLNCYLIGGLLQYCDDFYHTSTWICHGYTYLPHPEPTSHLSTHPIPLGCPRVLTLDALLHASNLPWSSILHMLIYMFQAILSNHPTFTFFHWVQKSVLYISHLCCLACKIVITVFLKATFFV